MKKLFIALFMMFGLCAICLAVDPFLGWNCLDNGALKAAIAKDNKDVPFDTKVAYTLMIALNENPSNVNTLAKCTEIVRNVYIANGIKELNEDSIFTDVIRYFLFSNNKTILKDIIASPLAEKNQFFKEWYIADTNWVNLPESEYKDILFENIKQKIKAGSIPSLESRIRTYVGLCVEDEDAVVVKKLQTLYRLAIVRLSTNENMKSVVVTISLALKGYGVDVK